MSIRRSTASLLRRLTPSIPLTFNSPPPLLRSPQRALRALPFPVLLIMAATATTVSTSSPSEITIRTLDPSITTFSGPFSRNGAEVGVRMSAIRLSDGSLVL